jgi:hypothetical protein
MGENRLMVDFGDVGRICLNREIRGVCEGCLWWEWDSGRQQCCNAQYHICPLYRERLFNLNAPLGLRPDLRPRLSGAGLGDQPASKVGGSGIS